MSSASTDRKVEIEKKPINININKIIYIIYKTHNEAKEKLKSRYVRSSFIQLDMHRSVSGIFFSRESQVQKHQTKTETH